MVKVVAPTILARRARQGSAPRSSAAVTLYERVNGVVLTKPADLRFIFRIMLPNASFLNSSTFDPNWIALLAGDHCTQAVVTDQRLVGGLVVRLLPCANNMVGVVVAQRIGNKKTKARPSGVRIEVRILRYIASPSCPFFDAKVSSFLSETEPVLGPAVAVLSRSPAT